MAKKKRKPGRPKGSFKTVEKKEATKVMRIPLSKEAAVKRLISQP